MTGQGVFCARAAGEGPYMDALVEQTPGHIHARIAESAGDDGEVGVRHPSITVRDCDRHSSNCPAVSPFGMR